MKQKQLDHCYKLGFIVVTGKATMKSLYLKAFSVEAIKVLDDGAAELFLLGGGVFDVKETPEQVLILLSKA